ncbi:GNAT family N-acetyltransferase [Muricoccus radiodurans]|uniref:GNAT family N-acetyltransferase n=1 Tax=Muricoccus radiodurans TaxID=2231721 RepID=UPI003CEA58C5
MSVAVLRTIALPSGLPALRDRAEAEGFRMLRVLEEDWVDGSVRFNGAGEALFTLVEGATLLGIGGVTQDPYADAGTARVRRLYVDASRRRKGLGRMLVDAIVEHAAANGFRLIRVRAPDPAGAFYERCGFLRDISTGSATHSRPLTPPG